MLQVNFIPSRKTASVLGRRGFEVTTTRYFAGSEFHHKRWLTMRGLLNYCENSGIDSSYGKFNLQGVKVLIHPKDYSPVAKFIFEALILNGLAFAESRPSFLTVAEYESICLITGSELYPDIPF